MELTRDLSTHKYDIVHIFGVVGDYSDDWRYNYRERRMFDRNYEEVRLNIDTFESIGADGLSALLKTCEAKLVVFATCKSLKLGAQITKTASVISSDEKIENDEILKWEECFYTLIKDGHSLSESYEISCSVSRIPMILLMRKNFSVMRSD